MELINTSRADVFLPYVAVTEAGTKRIARAIDGQLIEIEEATSTNKVKGHVHVPAGTKSAPGKLTVTKTEFAKLDKGAIESMGIIVAG